MLLHQVRGRGRGRVRVRVRVRVRGRGRDRSSVKVRVRGRGVGDRVLSTVSRPPEKAYLFTLSLTCSGSG